jgi:hypothetical protein
MAKEKSVPAQTSKDAEKDSLATTKMILSVATSRGGLQILDARRPGTCYAGCMQRTVHHALGRLAFAASLI